MSNNFRKVLANSTIFVVIVIGLSLLFFLTLTGILGGPSHEKAFEEIFERPIPATVSDIHYKYYSHLKGHGYYISFTASPEVLKQLFPTQEATPMCIDGVLLVDMWSAKDEFEKLHNGNLPDLKTAIIAQSTMPGIQKEFVMHPESCQLFCFYVVDADIR